MPLDQRVKPPALPGKKLDIQEWCKHRKQPKKSQTSNPIKPELGGYMPQRHEFEFPFNDVAEVPVATVKFSDHDTPEEREIKMKVMQVYHMMLEERQQRSEFVVAHNLLKWKTLTKFHKSLTNDEDKKMLTRLRPVLQVTTRDKWDALVDGMLRESSLRRAIDYYGDLRKEGVRTEREVEDFYARARKRGKYATRREQTLGPPPIYDGPASLSQLPLRRFASGAVAPPGLLDPAVLHNSELLGLPERNLAADLLLTADQYLVVKEAMLREYCRAGRLSKSDAQALASVDSLSAGVIYDFLCDCKWIVASED
jgi:transcriptional adapter 2-alpha